MENNMHIAIDGPAGSGKSTIAKQLAARLKMLYIDTGAMYRALTYKVIGAGIEMRDHESIIELACQTRIELKDSRVYLDGKDVSREIRNPSVDQRVSEVAGIPGVRRHMVAIQRQMAGERNVVMDGRDIGTFVLPEARFKFYLTATIEERACRRHEQLTKTHLQVDLEQVKDEMERRDRLDSTRGYSPLRAARDAILIDTTGKGIEEVLEEIIAIIGGKGDVL